MPDVLPEERPPQPEPDTPADREQVLELNFVPAWARKPPNATSFFRDRPGRPDRPDRRDGSSDRGRPQQRGPGGGPGGARGGAGGATGHARPRHTSAAHGDRDRRPSRDFQDARPQPLPVYVRFLPDDNQIRALVKRIRGNQRAYPISEIVALFLANPDGCRIKLESPDPAKRFLQCTVCGTIALERAFAEAHIMREHLGEFFDIEQRVGEPAAGNFVCVAKCGLSGTLLGPPNHNTYAERVEELHRMQFSHMAIEEYRRSIHTVHDEALVAQWREASRTQTLYRPKGAAPDSPGMKWTAAAATLLRDHGEALIRSTTQASLSVPAAREIQHPGLSRTLGDAWQRECRAPRDLTIAVQGALRGRHLHIFRVGSGTRFVTAVPPVPLDPERAIPSIRSVLTCLREHPGFTRAQLLETLTPGADPAGPEAAEILSPLRWLVDRGHIIEFFDGTMAVPMGKP